MNLHSLENYKFNSQSIPVFIVGCLMLWAGFFVYIKDKRALLNRRFLFICVSVSLWLIPTAIGYMSRDPRVALAWFKIDNFSVMFISVNVYMFIKSFLKSRNSVWDYFAYTVAFLFGVMVLCTDLVISDVYHYFWGFFPRWNIGGIIFIVFFFFGYMIASFVALLKKYRLIADAATKNQARYIFLAFLFAYTGSVDFLPTYGIEFYPFGFFSIGIFLSIIGFAIVKHQLMDIEVVIRRAAVFAGLFAFVYGIFSITTFIGQRYFENILGWNAWVSMVPTVIFITFMLRPLDRFLTLITEQFLFQKKYDYRQLLKTFTSEVLTLLDLQKLLESTVQGLNRIIKLESCGIMIQNLAKGVYELKSSHGIRDINVEFSADDTLVYYLNASHGPIQKDEDIKRLKGNGSLLGDFKRLNADLCLPILLHDKLIGFISLGRKKSGESYNQEDIDVLMSLARTEAIAISNAQLFQELSKTQAEAAQREKMAVIGTLAAGINHEICNPLGIARGQCEMFLLNYKDGLYKEASDKELVDKCTIIFEKVIKEVDRATGITKRLSSFAKPAKQFMLGEVDVAEEVQEILAILGHELRLDNIDVMTNIPKDISKIFADKKQIQEIIFNIVRNAAQAINGRGSISIGASERNERVFIEIEDTGCGIPADKLNEIFNPFYTTKAPGKGTGLGLFIVKQIVERNKGTIAVQSEVGKGTKFILSFSVARQMAAA